MPEGLVRVAAGGGRRVAGSVRRRGRRACRWWPAGGRDRASQRRGSRGCRTALAGSGRVGARWRPAAPAATAARRGPGRKPCRARCLTPGVGRRRRGRQTVSIDARQEAQAQVPPWVRWGRAARPGVADVRVGGAASPGRWRGSPAAAATCGKYGGGDIPAVRPGSPPCAVSAGVTVLVAIHARRGGGWQVTHRGRWRSRWRASAVGLVLYQQQMVECLHHYYLSMSCRWPGGTRVVAARPGVWGAGGRGTVGWPTRPVTRPGGQIVEAVGLGASGTGAMTGRLGRWGRSTRPVGPRILRRIGRLGRCGPERWCRTRQGAVSPA